MSLPVTRNPNLDLAQAVAADEASAAPGDDPLRGPRPASWWTGLPPEPGVCPGVGADGRITSLPQPDLARCAREEVLAYFENGWTLTEVLLSALQGREAFLRPPWHQLRHPMIFYLCHPAALYVNKLRVAGLVAAPVDPYFEQLFETGVDEMSWDDLSKNDMDWPPLEDVIAYRRRVHDLVRGVIEAHPGLAPGHPAIDEAHPLWALFLAFEHERIHLETSSVLLRELPLALVRRPEAFPALHPSAADPGRPAPESPLVAVPGGPVRLGKPRERPSFGWDNEYGARDVRVRPFRAARHLVTNGEFLAFVADGGYTDPRWWTADGWTWRQMRNAKWPTWWVADGPAGLHRYKLRALFEVLDLPLAWPVCVNWYEARAYCAWRGARDGRPYRLPTEAEQRVLRLGAAAAAPPAADPALTHSGRDFAALGLNLALAHGSEAPVDAGPPSPAGVHDAAGNVWQWLEDDFNPLPGFRVHRVYDDFSAPCFDGEHRMLLGGSFASTGDEASPFARFHFRPHFHQHAGFRLVVGGHDDADPADGPGGAGATSCDAVRLGRDERGAGAYEGDVVLDQYLLMHFGAPEDVMPYAEGPQGARDFTRRLAGLLADAARATGAPTGRALDVGCAVGGLSFELARTYGEVLGVDLSASFVRAAERLREDGRLTYRRHDEGELGAPCEAVVDPTIDRRRARFRRADACALPPELHGFDAVVLANLLCRLPSPRAVLGRLGGPRGLVRPGGLLLVSSPFTWREKFTPRDAWLGGRVEAGRELRSADALRAALEADFELLRALDAPFLVREHARKFEYVVPLVTLWRRR